MGAQTNDDGLESTASRWTRGGGARTGGGRPGGPAAPNPSLPHASSRQFGRDAKEMVLLGEKAWRERRHLGGAGDAAEGERDLRRRVLDGGGGGCSAAAVVREEGCCGGWSGAAGVGQRRVVGG